jgi:hypothetical protein
MRPANTATWMLLPLLTSACVFGTDLAEIEDPKLAMGVFNCLAGTSDEPPLGCKGRPVLLRVVVQGEKPGTGCLTLSSSVELTIDDREVSGSLGDEYESECDPPMFFDRLGEQAPEDIPSSQVVMADGSATFHMEVARLYAERTVALRSPARAELYPGDHVEMELVLPTEGETITRVFAQHMSPDGYRREPVRFTLSGRSIQVDIPTTVADGTLQVGGTVGLPIERCDGVVSCSASTTASISVPVVVPYPRPAR